MTHAAMLKEISRNVNQSVGRNLIVHYTFKRLRAKHSLATIERHWDRIVSIITR